MSETSAVELYVQTESLGSVSDLHSPRNAPIFINTRPHKIRTISS